MCKWHSRSAEYGRLVRLPLALSWVPKTTFIECNKQREKEVRSSVVDKIAHLLWRAFLQLFNTRQDRLQAFAQIAHILFDVG